jgi:hypothetical protein
MPELFAGETVAATGPNCPDQVVSERIISAAGLDVIALEPRIQCRGRKLDRIKIWGVGR